MQVTVKRVITAVVIVGGLVTAYQILSKPQPVAAPQSSEETRTNAQSFDRKIALIEDTRQENGASAEVRFTSAEVSAEVAESLGAVPPAPPANIGNSSPDTVLGQGNVQVKGYQVRLEGNVVRGQFVANVAGKDVWVTLAGYLGSRDGYLTFDPTEFKVGEFSIPVSLVNSALQKKLAEQREQLRLPPGIATLRIENGELVITQK
jgi:hypothetical protein